jgi:HEAT repeat protein
MCAKPPPKHWEKSAMRAAVEPLIAALKDRYSDVRQAASEALGKIGAPAVEPLIAALKNKSLYVRAAAAKLLGEIKDPRAVEPLIAALKDEKWDVRAAATEALVKIGTLAVEPLIAALKDAEWRCAQSRRLCAGGDRRCPRRGAAHRRAQG